MSAGDQQEVSQQFREAFAAAIESNDLSAVEQLLKDEPRLANADLRDPSQRNVFSDGLPLHRACEHDREELAEMLLRYQAHPDAPGPDPNDRPVHGMPLHCAAAEHQNYRLANRLIDHGATPNSYPNCDKSTIERMFYHANAAGMTLTLVRRSFAPFLADRIELESRTATDFAGADAAEATKLFARMVDLGSQPPFVVLVREGFHDLAMEIVSHGHESGNSAHGDSKSTPQDKVSGASHWYGYPQLLRRLRAHPSFKYRYEDAISGITTAIGSHNRDGGYPEYREIILMHLDALKSHGDLERAQRDQEFKPLYQIATDFTWHNNYGYRAEIAKPECYVDLAELFVGWGMTDIEYRDPASGHSPLSAAVHRGHHPGIATYILWLLKNGAQLRPQDPDEVNPVAIARNRGFDEIQRLLQRFDT